MSCVRSSPLVLFAVAVLEYCPGDISSAIAKKVQRLSLLPLHGLPFPALEHYDLGTCR